MNRLSPDKQEALKALFEAGGSIRMAVRKLGVDKKTARKYGKLIFREGIFCRCGQKVTHQGMCPFRFMSDGYEARRAFMKKWTGSKSSHCIDCGKGRSISGGSSGIRCAECYRKQVKARAFAWAAEKRDCKICGKENSRRADGTLPMCCDTEWCQRLYAFYYVEGRSRPPSAQGGKQNGLRFEFLLSDYLRRTADAKEPRSKHRRTA